MNGERIVGVLIPFLVIVISGLYTSLWGAFKDSPYEGFKPLTFPRSIYFHVVIFVVLYSVDPFAQAFRGLKLFQMFYLVMGLERFLAELYKGFFRTEDQSKYFVPSRITFLGRHVESDWARYSAGSLLVGGVCAVALIPMNVTSFWMFLGVAYGSGLVVSLGGAYKDAPFEGFKWLKFQRSAGVLAVASPLFYFLSSAETPITLGFLIYMNGGLERFFVEYYKTYIQRNMSGKFRPDLERIQVYLDSRDKFHYTTWVIIIGLIALYVHEL